MRILEAKYMIRSAFYITVSFKISCPISLTPAAVRVALHLGNRLANLGFTLRDYNNTSLTTKGTKYTKKGKTKILV
jgi:hypothetical protein